VVPNSEETNLPNGGNTTVADEVRIEFSELLRKAQVEGNANFLK
jgi:hypothetical protein